MSDEAEISSDPIGPDDLAVIERVLEGVRPAIRADGGDLQLVKACGSTVVLRLGGQCRGCMQSGETLGGIRRLLMHALGKALRVIPARDD